MDLSNVICLYEEGLDWTWVLTAVPIFRPCINLALFTFDLCELFGLICSQNGNNRNVGIGVPQRNADIVSFNRLRFALYKATLTFNS